MARARDTAALLRPWMIFCIAAVIVVSLGLRIWPLPGTWLWSDEIFSVSLAEAGFQKTLIGTFRHDLHPPVYYLHLVPWAQLFKSDAGLVLNSVLWDMARVGATMFVLYRLAGPTAAIAGGLAAAFLGGSLYNAENLRMYAMMGFAIIAAWALTERIFAPSAPVSWRDALLLLLCQTILVGAHGAGPFFVMFVSLHGIVLWWITGGNWRQRRPWLVAQAVVGLFGLLVIVNGFARATEHYQVDWGWQSILFPPAFMAAGTTVPNSGPAGILIAALVTTVLILLGLATPRARVTTIIYVVAPMLLALVLSATVKPIYGFRTMACAAVFLPVIIGLAFAEQRPRQVLAAICLLAVIAFGVHQRAFYQKEHDYPALAAYLRSAVQPGDVILQYHQPASAWALGRYLVGPGWGDIMRVQHPNSEKWDRLFARLGPGVASVFASETDRMAFNTIPIGLGEPAANDLVPKAGRIWVMATFVYDDAAVPPILRDRQPVGCHEFRGAFLCLYAPVAGKS